MCQGVVQLKWVLIPKFAELTGYSRKAVEGKIADGVFLPGKHYRKSPDGHIHINLQEYYRWVEGETGVK